MELLKDLESEYPNIKQIKYNIDEHEDLVNKYGIEVHPTVIFANHNKQELARLEKETNYDKYIETLEDLKINKREPLPFVKQKDKRSSNLMTFFLYNNEENKYMEVRQFVESKTNVKYPKISAMKFLLDFRENLPSELENKIPKNIKFETITTEDGITIITLSKEFEEFAGTEIGNHSERQIAYTILLFKDVEQVKIRSGNYESEIIDVFENVSNNYKYAPDILGIEQWSPILYVHEYNMNILHKDGLEFMPCYCGCGDAGHGSNFNCYFRELEKDVWAIDDHGENCVMCLDISNGYVKMSQKGTKIQDIRKTIDIQHRGKTLFPTNTPQP